MSNDTQVLDRNPVSSPVSGNQVQPQAPKAPVQPVQQPITSAQPSAPVGLPNKEVGPATSSMSEFVKPSEVEPQIDKDIAELGVEASKDSPNVADEHKDFIDHAKQFTPVQTSSSGKVTLPMSEDEITDKLKTGQDDDSGKWLAGLIQKVIRVFGL